MRRFAPFIVIGISLLTIACGSIGRLVSQAVPTPEVIAHHGHPEKALIKKYRSSSPIHQ
jgi:hypothetical protein